MEEFDFSKSRFHKDIYLSGMFLYVLAPACARDGQRLRPEQVNLATLRHVFAGCGFDLGEGQIPRHDRHPDRRDEWPGWPRLEQGTRPPWWREMVQRLGQPQTRVHLVDEIVQRLGQSGRWPYPRQIWWTRW